MAENNTASTADGDIYMGVDTARLEEARRDYRERRTTVDPDEPLAVRLARFDRMAALRRHHCDEHATTVTNTPPA